MEGIQGVGGVQEPNRSGRSSAPKDQANTPVSSESGSGSSDGVVISGEAQAAAQIAQTLQVTADQPDIRADKVAAAKAAIERGDYKKPEIVESVAQQVAKYL